MTGILDVLLNLDATLVYAIVGLLVFAEDALFIGFVLPGETAAVLGGVDASRGHVQFPAMIAVVVGAAIVGDTVGYEVGRHAGARLLRTRPLTRHQHRLQTARAFLARRGGSAVFLGRSVAFFRAVTPALAGTARMPYPRFLAFNAAGGLVWGVGAVTIGYLAGNSYQTVEKTAGRTAALTALSIAILALLAHTIRRRRRDPRGVAAAPAASSAATRTPHTATPRRAATPQEDQGENPVRGGPGPIRAARDGGAGSDPASPDPPDRADRLGRGGSVAWPRARACGCSRPGRVRDPRAGCSGGTSASAPTRPGR